MKNFIDKLKENNIEVVLKNDDLEIISTKENIPTELLKEIKINKDSLVQFFKNKSLSNVSVDEQGNIHYRTSHVQREIWITCQDPTASITYHLPSNFYIRETLDLELLKRALNFVLNKYEILRTNFKLNASGDLEQIIHHKVEADIHEVDYTHGNYGDGMDFINKDNLVNFDLENGLLLRCYLIHLPEGNSIFYYNIHHIIADEWSVKIFENEIFSVYKAYLIGAEPEKEVKYQYKDYIDWTYEQLSASKDHKKYWQDVLLPLPEVVQFPTDKIKPSFKTYDSVAFQMFLSLENTKLLSNLVQKRHGSLFMGVLTVLKALLYKYTHHEDIIVGSPMAIRERDEFSQQIGYFLRTLVLRNKVSSTDSFNTFFEKVKENLISAYEHSIYPLSEILNDIDFKRDQSKSSIFDISITFHEATTDPYSIHEIVTDNIQEFKGGNCKNDIEFHFGVINDQLYIKVNYNKDLYDSDIIQNFIKHYKELLLKFIDSPNTPLSELEYVSSADREVLLKEFNDTSVSYPDNQNIVSLFEEEVAKNPDSRAVVFEDTVLSYEELNNKANALAYRLQVDHGIKKGDYVGVMLNRGENQIVSILGILKLGAVYVPIDANLPESRKEVMTSDLSLLITESYYFFDLDFYSGESFSIDLEFTEEDASGFTSEVLERDDIAYIIYTSGSTGEPKGVLNTHGGILNTMLFQKEFFEVSSYENVAQFASFSFDASISEIFMTLLSGKSLHILSDSVRKDVYAFEEYVNNHSIDLVTLPPAFFSLLNVERLQGLKGLITAGESAIIGKTKEYLKYGTFYNAYGPTETSICATVHKLEKGSDLASSTIPIGQPIANTQIYILDENKHLVPAGVSGEMYISGAGLAQGYLNNPELTAEKFVDNPFIPGTKMYRTGDLGKWLADGTIEYLGRIDHQVKIRGHRIELGEIDSQVLSFSESIKSVVTEVKEHEEDKSLVVYYVSDTPIDKQDLARHLESKLPQYMLPGFYVELDQIPLTSNGKVDRKSLPEVSSEDLITTEYVAATSKEEKVLVSVCEQVLKHSPISIRDNYYNLGGDSIKSIQIVSRLRQQGYSLKVEHILQYPVLEELACYMTTDVAKIDQSEVTGESILTPIQRYFFESEGITNKNHYNQSVILKSSERLSASVLETSLKCLVEHHDALRMMYSHKDGKWNQYNSGIDGVHYRLASFDIRDSGSESEELFQLQQIGKDLQSTINIESGVLFHVGHVSMSDGDRIILVVHHLVMDGVSWRILLEDLGNLYESEIRGQQYSLPSKTDSFQSWGKALDEYSRSLELSKERLYWEGVESENYTALVTDYPVEGKQVLDKSLGFSLSTDATKLLQTRAGRKYSAEINDVLLTGLALALQNQFGVSKTKVLMEGHGREVMNTGLDISRTIGWFTSVYPFNLDISDNSQPALVSVKEGLRGIPNKGIGYGILNYLGDAFSSTSNPSIQFNYLGDFNEIGDSETEGKRSLFDYSSENIGSSVDSANLSTDLLLDVSGMTVNGVMSINIRFSDKLFTENTIQKLLFAYQSHLEAIVKESEDSSVILTPSDLTYKGLSFSTIEEISKGNDIEDIYELSPMQQGLYYHWLVDPHGSIYYMQTSYRIKSSELNLSLVEKAFGMLLNRHSILRTSFENRYGEVPLQIVHKKAHVDFKHLILESELELDNIKQGDVNRGFVLSEPTQMRLVIVELPDGYYEFIWSHHHIIMDGWCLSILINDFSAILSSLEHGTEINLPETKKYSSYIEWLREVDDQETMKYWESYLSGVNVPAVIPFERDRASANEPKIIVSNKIKIEGDSFKGIEKLCKNIGITINTYIQGVWGYLLSRYNGSEDAVFGAVVSGRPPALEDVENIVGLFINTIPIRVKYKKEDTVKEFFLDLHTKSIQSSPYHYSKLSDIQTISGLGNNMINNIIVFENYPVQDSIMDNYVDNESSSSIEEIKNVEVVDETNYYFLITVFPSEDSVMLDIKYDASVFNRVLMDNIGMHFTNLLKNIFIDGERKILEAGYLGENEKKLLLEDFNNTTSFYPENQSIVSLFEDQVKQTPDHTAIIYEDLKLSYAELNDRASSLAWELQNTHGIKKGDHVGVMLNRGENQVISILGILKLGAVYVPIDANLPESRKEVMTSGLTLLITESYYFFDLDFYSGGSFSIDLELTGEINSEFNSEVLEKDDIAYIIYTSGSTGEPKGVMNTHGGILNMTQFQKEFFGVSAYHNVAQFASFSFDASIFEIFMTLLCGKSLHILSDVVRKDSFAFEEYVEKHSIDIVTLPPAFFNLLNVEKLQNLKAVITAGESAVIGKTKEFLQHGTFYNAYGPTETSICATVHKIEKGSDLALSIIPIGKPIANTQIYILDSDKDLVAVGVTGEIYISGAGLAKGYVNNPELTSEKFIENPFIPGTKMYRSGDTGRWLPDGTIEYSGRIDRQVKVRGHRIELGEIDSQVISYSHAIKTAVTDVKEHEGDKSIVVYYVADTEIDKDELTKYLEEKLPQYMVPSFYVELEDIPLTSNGKIDRKKLPDVSSTDLIKNEYVAPVTPAQSALVEVCEQILKHSPISMKDNYYNLGGESIKSIQIVSKLRQKGYTLKVEHILQYPVLEEMTKHITSEVSAIEQSVVSGEISLTPIQRSFFEDEKIVNKNHFNQSVVLKSTERLSGSILENCIEQLVNHHDAMRMMYTNEEGSWRQFNSDISGKHYRYEYFDITSSTSETEELERLEDIGITLQTSIDITSGILFHVGHVSMSDGDRILLILHHLVADGISWRILLEDLNNLYDSAILGNVYILPAKTHSFQKWSKVLEEYSTSSSLGKERAYWESIESVDYQMIPTDYPLAENQVSDSSMGFSFDQEQTHLLQTNAGKKYNAEVKDILLTAMAMSLQEHFGISKTKVLMEGHGRENISADVDVSRTVGWFTSVYPFSLDIGDQTKPFILSVKEGLNNIPKKGIGYGVLHYLNEKIKSSSDPSICFNFMGSFDDAGGVNNKKMRLDFSSESIGTAVSADNLKTSILLDVSGIIVSGVLSVNILYSKNIFHESTIEKLSQLYKKNMIKILEENENESSNEWQYGDTMTLSPNQYHLFRNKYSSVNFNIDIQRFDENNFEHTLRKCFSRFPSLMTKYEQDQLQVLQRYISETEVAIKIHIESLQVRSEEDIKAIGKEFIFQPYDLFEGELIRVFVVKTETSGTPQASLFFGIHHSLLDNYSSNYLKHELEAYFNSGKEISMQPHHFTFIDSQEKFLKSDDGIELRNNQVNSLLTTPLYENKDSGSDHVFFQNFMIKEAFIKNEDFVHLRVVSKKASVPMNALCLSVFSRIMTDYKSPNKNLFGMLSSNRESSEYGNMMGVLTNLVMVSHADSENYSIEEMMKNYVRMIECRSVQKIPYQVIRQDIESMESKDIEKNIFGFYSYLSQNEEKEYDYFNEYMEEMTEFDGINLKAFEYSNGVLIQLSQPASTASIDFPKYIKEFTDFLKTQ
ncbi:amino acid adenylation domain-containing protein [Chryseobacterium sp. PTM-20240506]|uniref:amino acid adenylation domain-containing protein n=2 Tax=unclassified Chryseobacterium TaxID=2593645 RepID=UPI003AAC22CF